MAQPKKKVYRAKVSFNKEELAGRVSLGASGISMPYLAGEALEEYRKDFSRQRDSMNFGMLGNDPKYYDKNTVADVTPKPEDFIEVPFRLISATIVGGGTWKATDFSDVRMLKKSTNLLDGVPLYKDHETDLDNWVGLVNGVKWTKAFTNDDGTAVPAGIDGIVAIDKVTNPKVARGVLAGAIYSNSVTVEFDWEMSHPFENEWDFFNKVGTIGSDGKMIRRIAKNVHNYHESSLVWLGADPFAKAIKPDGNLKNIDVSSVYSYTKASFSKSAKVNLEEVEPLPENVEAGRNMTINFALDKNVLSLARRSNSFNNNKNEDMDKFIVAFIAAFGQQFNLKEGDKPTDEQMVSYLKQLSFVSEEDGQKVQNQLAQLSTITEKALEVFKAESEDNKDATEVDMAQFIADHTFVGTTEFATLQENATKVVELEKEKEALTTQVTELSTHAEIGKKYIGMKRAEAIRLYKVAVGEDNADAAVVEMFNKAEESAVEGLLKQYTKSATHKFSGTCADCGSTEFKFRSTVADDGLEDSTEEFAVPTTEDIYAKYNQASMVIGRTREENEN